MDKEKASGLKGNIALSVALILLAVFLLFLSKQFRQPALDIFYSMFTKNFDAHDLVKDFADAPRVFFMNFRQMLQVYLSDYVLSAYVFLLPALLLSALGISRLVGGKLPRIFSLLKKKSENRFLIGVFLIPLIAMILINFFIFLGEPFTNDEFSYLFQADLMSTGKLYAIPPPLPQFLQYDNIVCRDKWYSKYTIGWPFLLSLGRIFRIEWIVDPICASISLILIYLICRKLFGRRAGVAGVFLVMLSPIFIFHGASYFSHSSFGLAMLAYIYGILNLDEDKKYYFSIMAGIALALALNIRPADAAVLLIGSIPLVIYAFRQKSAINLIPRIIIILFLFGLGGGIVMFVNAHQTGDPFLMGYTKYDAEGLLGFGVKGHTLSHGIWNQVYSMLRLSYWTMPFLGILSICTYLTVKTRKPIPYFLAIFMAGYVILNLFITGTGNVGFGPRFYYSIFLILAIIASGGLIYLSAFFSKIRWFSGKVFFPIFILAGALYLALGFYPATIVRVKGVYEYSKNIWSSLYNPKAARNRSIIFLGSSPNMINTEFTRNSWRLNEQRNIITLFLLPQENVQFAKFFPDREVFLAFWDEKNKVFNVMPYFQYKPSPYDYFIAGMNYGSMPSFFRPRSIEIFKAIIGMKPRDFTTRYNIAYFFYQYRLYSEAGRLFEEIIRDFPQDDNSYFYLARCLGELGEKEKAMRVLYTLSQRFPKSQRLPQAADWFKYYQDNP